MTKETRYIVDQLYKYIQGTIPFRSIEANHSISNLEAALMRIHPEDTIKAMKLIVNKQPYKGDLTDHNWATISNMMHRFENPPTPVQEYLAL